MVSHVYNSKIDLPTLRLRFEHTSRDLSLQALSAMAADLGLISRGIRCEPDGLKLLKTPAVLHWRMDHFVVLISASRRSCVIHDPNQGRVVCSWQEIHQQFTGIALELWPGPDGMIVQTPAPRLRLGQLWALVRQGRSQLYVLLLLTLALQIVVLVGPWHVQWVVDDALVTGDAGLISVLSMGFALLLLLRVTAHLLRGLLSVKLGFALSFYLGGYLLQHLLQLPMAWFESRHVGDVVSRFSSLQPVRELFTQGLAIILVDSVMVVLSLLVLFLYEPQIAAVVVGIHGLFVVLQLFLVPRLQRQTMAVILAQAQEQSHLLESVRSIFNVKAYQQEAGRLSQWQNFHAKSLQQALGLQQTELSIGTSTVLVSGMELIIVIYLAAHSVLAGNFTVGMLFAFLSYRSHFTQRLGSLVQQVLNLRTMNTHLERLADIWFETPEVLPTQNSQPSPAAQPLGTIASLTLDNVSFQHGLRSPSILRDANVSIAPGEWITIVGPSGVGKTTVLKLFMGFTQPSKGQVLWGSHQMSPDVAQMLRRRSACVLQGDTFFSGNIVENITLYETPDYDRVNACLQAVGMLAVVEQLPLKHLSLIGDLSSGLSTGQMQRLVFARALYRQPDYLFLDECTANLDQGSVTGISHLLAQLRCTRIVVSHDWALAERADSVYELSDGRLQVLSAKSAAAEYPG